jgi:hypothetical protein
VEPLKAGEGVGRASVAAHVCNGSGNGGSHSGGGVKLNGQKPLKGLDLGYWLCLRDGIACKRPPSFELITKFLKTLEGRDKFTKVRGIEDSNSKGVDLGDWATLIDDWAMLWAHHQIPQDPGWDGRGQVSPR